jgi:outer membrane protein assembly factor BamB
MFEQANHDHSLMSIFDQFTTQAKTAEQSSVESSTGSAGVQPHDTMSETPIPETIRQDWKLPGINKGDHSAPKSSIVPTPDGNLIIAGDTGMIYSVTPDGTVNWVAGTHPSGYGIHGTPVVAEGTVYIGAYDGALYAFDVTTGEQRWRTQFGDPDAPSPLGGGIGGSPIYHEGTIYVAVEFAAPYPSGGLFAVDAVTGAVEHEDRWPTGHPHSTPAIDHETGTIAFGANDGVLYAWTFPELERAWSFEADAPDDDNDVKGAIGVHDGAFFFGSWNESIYRVDAATGTQQWASEADGYVMGGTVVDTETGTVYTGSHDEHCYALDAASGDVQWRFETDGWITGCPAITPEHVLIGSYDGHLYALDKETGEEAWNLSNHGWITSKPLVHDGALYYTESASEDRTGGAYRYSAPSHTQSADNHQSQP